MQTKHNVLIFGERTYGRKPLNLCSEFCEVEFIPFPNSKETWKNLDEYELVILDYSVFSDESQGTTLYLKEQDSFEASMFSALESGTCFVFLHSDESVPVEKRHGRKPVDMDEEDVNKHFQSQMGFRWLRKWKIRPLNLEQLIPGIRTLKKNEFRTYMNKWGTTKNTFYAYGKECPFSDVICGWEDYATAFTLDFRKGKIIYLPCWRRFDNQEVLNETFTCLVDSLVTYLTKSRTELPQWAKAPLFDEEEKLAEEKAGLDSKLGECQKKLDIFHFAKQLAFQSEYGLEEALPKFLEEQCNIPTRRKEIYREDFWLLDCNDKEIVICEAKSSHRGLKRGAIYQLYNHREGYDLNEEYPAVLFANINLNAGSWKEKNRPIDEEVCKIAGGNHILIVRILDLLFAWQALREGKMDSKELLCIFQKNIGWLKFKEDRSWEILK